MGLHFGIMTMWVITTEVMQLQGVAVLDNSLFKGKINKNNNLPFAGNYQEIFNILMELFISSFKWTNLPPTINQRYLEISLFNYGKVAFFKDDVIGHLALKAVNAGNLDVYYEPTRIQAYGGNGYQKTLTNHIDSVMIYNNFVRDIPFVRLLVYAKRIYNIEKTIDVNVHQQRFPYLIKTSKKQEFTVKNIFKKYDDYEPAIFVDEALDTEKLACINTNVPFVADKLEEHKRKLWNEALSFIGIENNFSEKNERLTRQEVMISNGLAIACRNAKLQARQKAVDEINKMFGLNITVETNNLSVIEVEAQNNLEEVGDDNE